MLETKRLTVFESHYYRTYTNSVRIVGLWPYESIYLKIIIRLVIIILLTTFMTLQCIRFYEELGHDIDIVLELTGSIAYFSGCIIKYVITIKAQSNLQFLYEKIQGQWETFTDKTERQILEQSASDNQFLIKLYSGAAYGALVVYTSSPLVVPIILDIAIPLNESRKKTFPYFIEYFIDTEMYYYQLMIHGTICFTISVMVYISIDAMYASCCQHLCGLFDIVDHRLKEAMKTNNNVYVELKENDTLLHKLLSEAIVIHQKSIEFAVLIENIYATSYIPILGLNLAAIVIVAVDIVINLDDMNQIIRLSILYVAFSFHLFFNSVPGQKLHDKSSNVMNSAYFSEWYNLPLNARKLIQLIMHRSLNPCQFTAGGLFILDMENFGAIMKSSMSYITVLSSIR